MKVKVKQKRWKCVHFVNITGMGLGIYFFAVNTGYMLNL